ncbi:MAG: hypothetical protein BYD32DRAFT_461722 [Podila humilis]|nr:MAG: hypothetical protein BYD32DRAFT_461722 [Podila humilis]
MFKFKSTAAVLMPSSAGTPYLRPSPLDIPEILERIFSSLNRRTVLHLVRRVCRQCDSPMLGVFTGNRHLLSPTNGSNGSPSETYLST